MFPKTNQWTKFSFPKQWVPKCGTKLIIHGSIAAYIITVCPLLVLPFLRGFANRFMFADTVIFMSIFGVFINLLNIVPLVVLTIYWSVYFKTNNEITSKHAWGILGGYVVISVLLAALYWPWWWIAWDAHTGGAEQHDDIRSPLNLVFISAILIFIQFFFIFLGTCLGLLVGSDYKVYPTSNHTLLILLGLSGLAIISIILLTTGF